MPARPSCWTHRAAVVAASTALALGASGCATGFNAETNRAYDAAVGTNARSNGGEVLNALFVTNPDDTATMSATVTTTEAGGDTLTDVSVRSDDGEVQATLEGPVEVGGSQAVRLGDEEPLVVLEGDFRAGQMLRTTLTFQKAGPVTLWAPVVERTAEYREIDAPPLPTPTPSAEATPSEGATPSDGATPTPTGPTTEPTG